MKVIRMSMLAILISILALNGSTHAADPRTKPYEDFTVTGTTTINDVRRFRASGAGANTGTSEADSLAKAKARCDSDTRCIGYYVNRNKCHVPLHLAPR